jgi:hypothetical protein
MTPYQINEAVNTFLDGWTHTAIRQIGSDAPALPFIESHFIPGSSTAFEVGKDSHKHRVGMFFINVFTRPDSEGLKQGLSYCGALEDMFNAQWEIGALCFQSGNIKPESKSLGIDENLQARHFQVAVPFSVLSEA